MNKLLMIVAVALLCSCSSSRVATLESRVAELEAENAELQEQCDALRATTLMRPQPKILEVPVDCTCGECPEK